MINNEKYYSYDTNSERELIKMWEDLKGGNLQSVNRSLMKTIAQAEEVETVDVTPLYSKQMWDSEVCDWVPFDLWGAHFMVNSRKEYVQLRMYRPLSIQPEFGPPLYGWHTMDSSYLNEQLKEKENPYDNYEQNCKSFAGRQAFKELMAQDRQEYRNEQRYEEMPGYDDKVGY